MKHFALGPFSPAEIKDASEKLRHGCLKWLDKKEMHSVIYVSFGSIMALSDEQITELALGWNKAGLGSPISAGNIG